MSDDDPDIPSLDSDHPMYMRGFVLGIAWEAARRDRYIQITVPSECSEMIMRIADRLGLPFNADALDDGWLDVTIGTTEVPV